MAISAGTRDGADDVRITVLTRETPLWKVMDGVWSLLSYDRARWNWTRAERGSALTYRLSRPLAAQKLGAGLREWMFSELEKQSNALIRMAELPDDERRRQRNSLRSVLFNPSDSELDRILNDKSLWECAHIFSTALSREFQTAVLRGRTRVEVSPADMSARGRGFIKMLRTQSASAVTDKAEVSELPPKVSFRVRPSMGKSSPTLWIDLEKHGEYGFVGAQALERGYRQQVEKLWRVTGDSVSNAKKRAAGTPMLGLRQTGSVVSSAREAKISNRIAGLFEGADIPIIARLPHRQPLDPGALSGQEINAVISKLKAVDLMCKWRGDVLIIDTLSWPIDELSLVQTRIAERLMQTAEEHGGFLPFESLCELSTLLVTEQIEVLTREYQVVMPHVNAWRPLLALCARHPGMITAMRTGQGLAIDDETATALRSNTLLSGTFEIGRAKILRMLERDTQEGATRLRSIHFQLIDEDGKPIGGVGFRYPPALSTRAPQSPQSPNN